MPPRVRGAAAVLPWSTLDGCVVDLTARAYDGLAALSGRGRARACPPSPWASTTTPTCGGRRGEAGAAQVYAYRALFEHGDRDLGAWIAAPAAAGTEDGAR